MAEMENVKIPLPKFLKLLTNNDVPISKAMNLSAKIYKTYNTGAQLAQLNDLKLLTAGIDQKEDRKIFLNALRDSGYLPKDPRRKVQKAEESSSTPSSNAIKASTSPKLKRKRFEDVNELLPTGPVDEVHGSLEFEEILDEQILKNKSAVVNRAPLVTAWATIVAERLGFRREEALSIASVYTEMNAVKRGVPRGVYKGVRESGLEAMKGGSQSYIELMGRRPLYRTQDQRWRALSSGLPVKPSVAFSYISRAFRQTTPHIIGALVLLAGSFDIGELDGLAWGLYRQFRPTVDQWGARSEVKCLTILNLRRKDTEHIGEAKGADCIIPHHSRRVEDDADMRPDRKKRKSILKLHQDTLPQDSKI